MTTRVSSPLSTHSMAVSCSGRRVSQPNTSAAISRRRVARPCSVCGPLRPMARSSRLVRRVRNVAPMAPPEYPRGWRTMRRHARPCREVDGDVDGKGDGEANGEVDGKGAGPLIPGRRSTTSADCPAPAVAERRPSWQRSAQPRRDPEGVRLSGHPRKSHLAGREQQRGGHRRREGVNDVRPRVPTRVAAIVLARLLESGEPECTGARGGRCPPS